MSFTDQFYDVGDVGCAFGPKFEIAYCCAGWRRAKGLRCATDPNVTGHQIEKHEGDRYLLRRK
jgi:hypothetical protein